MSEIDKKNILEDEPEQPAKEFILEDFQLNTVSSAETIKKAESEADEEKEPVSLKGEAPPISAAGELIAEESETEAADIDPIFKELSEPKLPVLGKENRARLQMQSPNRLYFYWSIKNNPFQTLQKVFGGNAGSYQLVAKFVNLKNEREEIHPVEPEGNYWYNAEADARYRAEIGFYAPNRPYIRVIFSNLVETPRKSPSPRAATDADWAVSATIFAEVLDHSGFSRDAFEVALAGDDAETAETSTQKAFYQLIGNPGFGFSSEEIRFALLALASGVSLDELRGQISDALFAVLLEHAESLSAEKSLSALEEHFDISAEEYVEEETEIGAAVYGASLVNFPKSRKKRTAPKTLLPRSAPRLLPKLSPVSSLRV